ncbi:MAG: DUF433 domain-containing protein [Candidatus Nanoarchaeia archaeon]
MLNIITNPNIRHGKPVVEGTRITVDEILGMLESGMTYKDIQKEYHLKREHIQAVVYRRKIES